MPQPTDRPASSSGVPAPADDAIARLRNAVAGEVITPDDAGYADARAVYLGDIDIRPAAIVRVADAMDAARVVDVARETGVELAVRCGGHSAGHCTTEGGVVLDVRGLTSIDLDLEGRTAWVGAGLSAGALTTRLAEHGLAIPFGDTGSVGVAGITLPRASCRGTDGGAPGGFTR